MKKTIKILGIILLVILALALGSFVYINSSGIPTYEVVQLDYQVKSSAEAIERGHKLTLMLCANCHMDRTTGLLTGTKMKDAPPEFGNIYSTNITQDKEYGIGDWTDGELLYLLRTGIKRDGAYSPPYMAKLPLMADEDINAIIAFLRSDHRLVNANPTPDQACEPSFLTKMLTRVAWKPFPMPTAKIEMPDTNNALALGEYLAHNLDCFSCHSADFKSNNYLSPTESAGYFGGGNKLLDLEGRVMLASNITPDKTTGIGSWNKNQFISAIKYGQTIKGPALVYPMMPYTMLSDHEAGAIYDYLQTIPALKNEVERKVYN